MMLAILTWTDGFLVIQILHLTLSTHSFGIRDVGMNVHSALH